jgi:hypothetical protein
MVGAGRPSMSFFRRMDKKLVDLRAKPENDEGGVLNRFSDSHLSTAPLFGNSLARMVVAP